MPNESTNNSGQCSHDDCETELEDRKAFVDATTNERYCSKEHLLADANNKELDGDGNVVDHPPGTRDADTADELTVKIPEGEFSCEFCRGDDHRASRENGEWVCYGCGQPLPDRIAEAADRRLADGHGEDDYTERQAQALAESLPVGDDNETPGGAQ